ncbi:LacI family transcriptional regulator [Variovorax sp. TBS-050B]|uniref:LacI family DNA-binding transcriptional regulator n=1 Tax=Variovorax sp. TBS-050B TaxID=2940551 RepID=UPI0024733040|nr:LacI family DNA-binding transcriptional regulator [Variovorax sp. TBS-050B]MDH6590254.1 LacI family transcriptional regulator [Variovorax sp. TBS-050B]
MSKKIMRKTVTSRPVTILDVAAAAKLSKSTVSLVLKGSPLIPAETADRVRAAASELGYVYNSRAGELRGGRSKTIGVVVNDLANPFFAEILVGVERKLVEAGYIVLMAHTNEDVDRQRDVLRIMREQGAAGTVLCPAYGTPRAFTKEVEASGMPLVVMVRTLGPGKYDFAGADNERGIYAATKHLLDAGHKKIGFLGGLTGVVLEQRLNGFRAALAERKIKFDESLVVAAQPTRRSGSEAMRSLLDMKPRPTAAVCYNDVVAFGALSALGERGLHAGRDFALTGFDNVRDAAHSNPPLTTVDIQPDALGEHAATLLLNRIQEPARARQVYLAEPQLVIRQSA